MQAYLLVGPTSVDGGGRISPGSHRSLLIGGAHRRTSVVASAAFNDGHNHYDVLGVSPSASSADIKKAYRFLALKYHPDVCKDSRADELFKIIRLAYDTLSNEISRNQYDQALKFQEGTSRKMRGNWDHGLDDEIRIYRWSDLRRRMKRQRYWENYNAREENPSFSDKEDDASHEETRKEERGSFIEVLRSAFLSLFLMQTIGARLSLTCSSLMALLDRKLDVGYKAGYLIAWVLGGRGGILLTLCLSFASWVCGKTSSSLVAVVVLAMWVGTNLARYTPVPQGALLTLLYMCINLQNDLY